MRDHEQSTGPVDQARRLARSRFPGARAVVLAGSTASGRATATSDLDIAVLLDDGPGAETYRETIRHEGRVVELFVHTRTGLGELFAADVAARRAVLQTMYVNGIVLADRDGAAAEARALAEADLLAGPPALAPETVESKRYGLTDALDDLGDCADRVERLAVGGFVLGAAADLLCDHRGTWLGGGKWLPRRLLDADAAHDTAHGAALLDGHLRLCEHDETAPLVSAVSTVLALVGGPVREGYRRTWHGVIDSVAARG
ncbi:nucleotidyltransferase domain-containing protein [Streptomyces sp. NPDC056144]|uniref:nucleotidyltransferase domain-containing protein n=1 Tax=unclassified Streptomyces TaxID=2593676 RepID=UPI0035DF471B